MLITRLVPSVVKGSPLYQKMLEWYYSPRSNRASERDEYQRIGRLGKDNSNAWIRRSSEIEGWLFEGEHEFIFELAGLGTSGDILEIGSWQGKATCLMAGACIELGLASKIICVDSFLMDGMPHQTAYHRRLVQSQGTYYQFVDNAKKHDYYDRLIILSGLSRMVLPYLQARIKLAFIDGAHDRESVARDVDLVKPLLIKDGLIALHDADEDWPGVKEAIKSTLANDSGFKFVRQVNTLECWQRVS